MTKATNLLGTALGAFLLNAAPVSATPDPGGSMTFGITGQHNQSGRRDPGYLLNQAAVQALVAEGARGPLTIARMSELLRDSDATADDLAATGILVRRPDGLYRLGLNYLTAADQRLIRDIARDVSARFAAAFLSRRENFDRLLNSYDLPNVDRGAIGMALIGAVVLDWDGLGITATEGYRLPTVRQATGDQYVPWAREKGEAPSVRGLYWGSHNSDANGIMLTTFGDHYSLPRIALPDLFWSIGPDELSPHLPDAASAALLWPARGRWDEMQNDAARMMIRLREGPADAAVLAAEIGKETRDIHRTLELLQALNYVRKDGDLYSATVPVFTERDRPMITAIRAEGRRIMSDWLRTNYPAIRERLSGLTAIRAGVPFEQMFTEIWHDLFGWTNYRLATGGLLLDPYGPESAYKGFQPFVWQASLNLTEGTRVE